jgi:hypothetical protein
MFEQSTLSEGEDGDMVTYEGHLTHLVKALNYSTPYYTKLRKHLMRMGCIQQLRRGGGTAPSVWWLKKEPDEESFKHAVEMLRPGNRPQDAIAQQLKDHNERILVLEQALEIR